MGRLGSVGASWVVYGSGLGLVPAIVILAVSVILISCTRPPCPYRLRKLQLYRPYSVKCKQKTSSRRLYGCITHIVVGQ